MNDDVEGHEEGKINGEITSGDIVRSLVGGNKRERNFRKFFYNPHGSN